MQNHTMQYIFDTNYGAYYRNGKERLVLLNTYFDGFKTGLDTHPPYGSAELSCI